MATQLQCPYCGGRHIVENSNGELVCVDCASVIAPVFLAHRRISKKEVLLAWRYGYI